MLVLICRISQTHLTKAAWTALVNEQPDRAIRMLKQSDSQSSRPAPQGFGLEVDDCFIAVVQAIHIEC